MTDELTARVAALEKSNRRLRTAVIGLSLIGATVFCCGQVQGVPDARAIVAR